MERFDHDDEAYLRWIAAHLSGVVINCFPNPSTDYLVLHRSTCPLSARLASSSTVASSSQVNFGGSRRS